MEQCQCAAKIIREGVWWCKEEGKCVCHSPTKTNSEHEELKKWFEVNYLDGDEIQDGQTLSSQECFEALAQQQSELLERVKEIVSGNYKGAFTDNAGFECWYVDDLLESLDSLIDTK